MSNADRIELEEREQEMFAITNLRILPCTNCGSSGWTQLANGEYVRGCCSENGDHRVKFLSTLATE